VLSTPRPLWGPFEPYVDTEVTILIEVRTSSDHLDPVWRELV